MNYEIFTDGSSRGNPGPGGWGVVIRKIPRPSGTPFFKGGIHAEIEELGGREEMTTNNRMELTAAIKALKRVVSIKPKGITINTDSEYLIKGITQWIHGWKRRRWIGSSKKPVLNQDLWMELDELVNKLSNEFDIHWKHVRGHSGIIENERCDEIATSFADGKPVKLRF